jgi:transposase
MREPLIGHGHARPTANLFAAKGRDLLARLQLPEPWQGTVAASLALIETLDEQVDNLERELRRLGADHAYIPLPLSIPGIGWVLAYTIASEIGDIARFASPCKLPSRATGGLKRSTLACRAGSESRGSQGGR